MNASSGSFGGLLESCGCSWHYYDVIIFELIGEITNIETIAAGSKIQDIERLRKTYGSGRWRKLKGIALVSLEDGTESDAELHWYEAHGIGKKEMKVKNLLD